MSGSAQADFFVSYTQADRAWAEWIGWQLEQAGYTVILQAWDFLPGTDWVYQMHVAVQQARRMLAVLSPSYLEGSEFGEAEWRVAFAADPSGDGRRLIPVRVTECHPQGLLRTRVYVDLVGRGEQDAAAALFRGVSEHAGRPESKPAFPGGRVAVADRPRFPALLDGDPTTLTMHLDSRPRELPTNVPGTEPAAEYEPMLVASAAPFASSPLPRRGLRWWGLVVLSIVVVAAIGAVVYVATFRHSPRDPASTWTETTGTPANTWANPTQLTGAGAPLDTQQSVQVLCRVSGYVVPDGDPWWYLIASAPWDGRYYATSDAFYDNGATSGPVNTGVIVDLKVPLCSGN